MSGDSPEIISSPDNVKFKSIIIPPHCKPYMVILFGFTTSLPSCQQYNIIKSFISLQKYPKKDALSTRNIIMLSLTIESIIMEAIYWNADKKQFFTQ